jgi:ABC-2 type transport system permease protein
VIRVYRALLLAQLQLAAQYRLAMFLYLLFSIMRPLIFLAAWSAVALARGGSVNGFTPADFAAYYVILTIVQHFVSAWNQYDFELQVRMGQISPRLVRPLDPIHYAVAENIVWKSFTFVGVLPVLALIVVTYGVQLHIEPWQIALFVPSLLLAAALQFLISWAIASTAFWTTRTHAVSTLFDRTAFIFAGQIAPLSLLPGVLQQVAYVLPFGYIYGVPTDILRGGHDVTTSLVLMGVQALWVAGALAASRVVWRFGLRAYTAVGA